MLMVATLGMSFYGLYSIIIGITDLLAVGQLEWWANLWLIGAGSALVFGAVLVRASMPGSLALATAGLLALQSISLQNTNHLYREVTLLPQLARLIFASLLVTLAYVGWDWEGKIKI